MRTAALSLVLLGLICFSLATDLVGWYNQSSGRDGNSADVLTVALGDSRKLFAQHIYSKADAYFHSGYYPSIFDRRPDGQKLHMAAQTGADAHGEEEESDHLGEAADWIDRFSRHFFPSEHRHLGEEPCAHHDHGDHDAGACPAGRSEGRERELLPWLRLAAELDPERPETYIVAAYWLRSHLDKVTEAEQFLREGLRANPGNPEILFELGRIYRENRSDPARARNLWELSLAMARKENSAGPEANLLLHAQILGNLAKLEEELHHPEKAREYLQALLPISPNKTALQKWIDELGAK